MKPNIERVKEAVIRELDRRNYRDFDMSPHKGLFNFDEAKSDPDDGIFWFYADTGDSFNLGWQVCAFVSDYDPPNSDAKPTLRGIVEWIEGDMIALEKEAIPNRNI